MWIFTYRCFLTRLFSYIGVKPSACSTRSGMLHLAAMLLLACTPASAQDLPFHFDPSARDLPPNPGQVPAIRFLTTADFPPFNYRDSSGALIGFNIDLARKLCDVLTVACTVQAWPWDQVTDALADNQGDALLAGLAITPEAGERFDFSSIYLALPGRFVAQLGNVASFDATALTGKTIAVRRGSAHAEFIRRYVAGATITEFDSEIEGLEAVKGGIAELFFGDAMRASFWLNANTDCCGFAGDPYFRPDLFGEGLAAAVPAGKDAVRKAIDWGLVRLNRDGVLDELYLRWFPVGFY
jgi:polar amino acid transport system substrate-binding protein